MKGKRKGFGTRPKNKGREWRQEVLSGEGVVFGTPSANRRSSERFQGRNGWISSGAFPPAAAQPSKYHISHRRGLSFQRTSVAKSENIIAAKRPLHKEPEP